MEDVASVVLLDPGEIDVAPPFSTLFPIRKPVSDEIEKSMRTVGYDQSKPINVWRATNLVVDGHTRRGCAEAAGVKVAVFYQDFADEDEALEYAIRSQRDRRNLTDADIFRCVEALDRRSRAGRPSELAPCGANSGKTSRHTAEVVGTNHRRVERARTVIDHGDEETKRAVLEGQMGITMAYNKTVAERRAESRQRKKPVVLAPRPLEPTGGAPVPRSETPVDGEEADWLASLSTRSLAADPRYDLDARLYRKFEAELPRLKQMMLEVAGTTSTAWMGPIHKIINRMVNLAHPNTWLPCSSCGGKGVTDKSCNSCRGTGYRVP